MHVHEFFTVQLLQATSLLWIFVFFLYINYFSLPHCTCWLDVKSIYLYVGVHFSEETPLSFFQRSLYPTVSFLGYIVKPTCKYLEAHFKYVSSLLYRYFCVLSPPSFSPSVTPPPPSSLQNISTLILFLIHLANFYYQDSWFFSDLQWRSILFKRRQRGWSLGRGVHVQSKWQADPNIQKILT